MTPQPVTSFDPDTTAFVLSELEDMGVASLIGGLEAELMVAAGEIESVGVTQDMRDGSAAATVAYADIVALALGHGPKQMDQETRNALAPYMEELQAEVGLADLAQRALDLVADPGNARFADTKGACADAQTFRAMLADVCQRVAKAREEHPELWTYTPSGGVFKVTMYDTEGRD